MRKLLWFTVGFTVACAVGVWLVHGIWLCACAISCALILLPLLFVQKKTARTVCVLLVGIITGLLWNWGYDAVYLAPARELDGKTVEVTLTVSDYGEKMEYSQAADASMKIHGKTYRVRVYSAVFDELTPGDQLCGTYSFRYSPGGSKESTYHKGEGIFLIAYEKGEARLTRADQHSPRYALQEFSHSLAQRIREIFPEDVSGFALALFLGDDTDLSYPEDEALQTSGIRHVIAVSGLHVSILFSMVYFVSGKKPVLTAVVGLPVLFIFAALTGFSPSVIRACVMQGLMILASALRKEYDAPSALACAVLCMLTVNPMVLSSVSFQLSVACVIGILLFYQPLQNYLVEKRIFGKTTGKGILARISRFAVSTVSVSLSATLLTAPFSAFYFGVISLVGVITNLLTMWIVSLIFYGIMAVCLVSYLWVPMAQLIACVIAWPIRYVLWVAEWMSQIPFAAIYTDSIYSVIWLICAYIILFAFAFMKKKRPLILAGSISILLVLSIVFSCMESRLDRFRVTVLNVGHGQCILLQSGNETCLIDCGSDSSRTAALKATQHLRSKGINRLDRVVVTHYDKDHASAVPLLLNSIPTDLLLLPDADRQNETRKTLLAHYGAQIQFVQSIHTYPFGIGTLTLIPAPLGYSSNESSICILFQQDNYDILITGDRDAAGEHLLMQQYPIPQLELLVTGHHGSEDASSMEFLRHCRPEAVIVSTSERYGKDFSESDTLCRYEMIGADIYRTDLMGSIVFRR